MRSERRGSRRWGTKDESGGETQEEKRWRVMIVGEGEDKAEQRNADERRRGMR